MPFDYSRIKKPDYFEENRLPAHSDHLFYKNMEEAKSGKSGFTLCLNGLWKFSYAKNYTSAVPGFEARDYCCKNWGDIRVPAHIQFEGYDVPQYANVQNPWDGREDILPGEIPSDFNPVASYVKYFTLPEDLRGFDNLFVSFGGVESSFALWLNGHYVGYASDSMTPSDFDLTPYYNKDGENKLAAQVFKWSAGSWIQDQDFYRFSGIFRDVFLYVKPAVHVEDIKIVATLDDDYCNGLLSVTLKASAAGKAEVRLIRAGETVASMSGEIGEASTFGAEIKQPEQWSAESPSLYDLVVEIKDKNGALQEVITEKVGFRRFEIKDCIMHLNGKRIVFNGTNRHEFGSLAGRVMTVEDTRLDLITMKRNNLNAVRTSHYPNNSFFYRLCDEYGLYVIDEANLESHAAWDASQRPGGDPSFLVPGDKPEWLGNLLSRANNMYQRDKNRPCVLIWSCGNECFGGKDIYEMSQLLRRLDSTRAVHYEGVANDPSYPDTTDIASRMYTPAAEVEQYLKEHREKPFILCEYVHAMGNSCGAMHKYIELGEREPLYQGGFIWDYIDQSILKKDRYGNEFYAYGGDFGERPTDYEFCGNGIVYGDRTPSPKMQEVKFLYQSIKLTVNEDTVLIENKNLFTSTAAWDCIAVLEREGRLLAKSRIAADVPPLTSREYPLPFAIPEENGEYAVTVSFVLREDALWADKGYEIAFGQGVITKDVQEAGPKPASPPLKLIKGWHNCGVKGEHFDVLFSRISGGLVSYRIAGVEMLESMPIPNFWRAPTDNDRGNLMPARYGQWKLASMYASTAGPGAYGAHDHPDLSMTKNGEDAEIAFVYHLPTKPAACCEVLYRVSCDGTVTVTMRCEPPVELGDMPVFGMMFKMCADYGHVQWYGNGPEETYSDRKHGAKLGVYKGLVTEQMAKYLVPQETGNKTGVRWAKVTDRQGRGLSFSAPQGGAMEFSALPYTPFEIENATHQNELPPVHYTVIRVNMAQMGIAGDNTWGARTHPEYLLPEGKPLSFTFSFKVN